MIEVRALRREDIPAMLDGCARLHPESRYACMDYDVDEVEAKIETGLIVPEYFFIEILTIDGTFAGALFAEAVKTWFGKDWVAQDVVFFVLPEYRGRCFGALRQITRNYRRWAADRNAKIVNLSTSTGIETDRTAKFFERMGFPRVGSMHSLVLQ